MTNPAEKIQAVSTEHKVSSTASATGPATAHDSKGAKNDSSDNSFCKNNKKDDFEYEFFGPCGTAIIVLVLPIVVLSLSHWSYVGYVDYDWIMDPNKLTKTLLPSISDPGRLWKCCLSVIGWFMFQVALERFLPCDSVEGPFIQNDPAKGKLKYNINGHLAFWITLLVVFAGYPVYHTASETYQLTSFPIEVLYENFAELAFCSIVLCYILSTYLYVDSFRGNNTKILAAGGNSGNVFYDFFIGRELNPRFGTTCTFDWKEFCELRPGLIGWMLLNLSCLKVQYNSLGYVSYSMYLITIFQGMYVWDAQYNEKAILTTMDITTDGFGFMLVFGDLAWVPFTYSLQAKYLVRHDPNLSVQQVLFIIAMYFVGYLIFRGANSEKDAFRTNPNDPALKHLQFIQTNRGTRLLTSGWWGMARKINYTGDYIIALSWCMVCGFDSIVPYYYAIYFAILLIHRSIRDDHMCQTKYGADWERYKQIVKYRFIPGIV